mmetsp:Transcript_86480/g.197303  ORF Transcript_86480/g.197303 Transcript_86480/m.197303 type:complete len:256 (-) Transcript_86480:2236-3003(-)
MLVGEVRSSSSSEKMASVQPASAWGHMTLSSSGCSSSSAWCQMALSSSSSACSSASQKAGWHSSRRRARRLGLSSGLAHWDERLVPGGVTRRPGNAGPQPSLVHPPGVSAASPMTTSVAAGAWDLKLATSFSSAPISLAMSPTCCTAALHFSCSTSSACDTCTTRASAANRASRSWPSKAWIPPIFSPHSRWTRASPCCTASAALASAPCARCSAASCLRSAMATRSASRGRWLAASATSCCAEASFARSFTTAP